MFLINDPFFSYAGLVADLKRHFNPEIQAEKISYFDPGLQGFKAFEPDRRPELADRFRRKFPRCPVDWNFDKLNFRPCKQLPTSYTDYAKALGRQRSGDDLPQAKAQKTLSR